jgi:hypothetical protein
MHVDSGSILPPLYCIGTKNSFWGSKQPKLGADHLLSSTAEVTLLLCHRLSCCMLRHRNNFKLRVETTVANTHDVYVKDTS